MYKPMIGAAEKDLTVIDGLKRCVEEKLGWGPGNEWTHQQYEELCDRINSETKILLSTNTVKRFFGKIQSNSLPGKTTLNTFARFCGFESYYDFAEKNTEYPNSHQITPGKIRFFNPYNNKKLVLIATFIAVILASAIFIFTNYQKEKLLEQMQFSQTWKEGFVPFTQIFKYQVSPAFSDTIHFIEHSKGGIALSTQDSIFSWMHFVPGFRKVSFTSGNRILWENTYMVKTRGWLFIFPWGGLEPRKYISLDSCKSYLTVSDELLNKNKIDLVQDGGWAHYFNAQNFNAEGTDFTLSTTFRNPIKTGTQQCQNVIVSVECETFEFRLHFTQTGCQKFAEINMGNEIFGGIQNDLTSLTFEMDQWQTISINSKNGILSVSNHDKKIFEKAYSGKPGKVTGLRFSFRGNGLVDQVALFNGQGERVYFDDFE
jgi:hypothetical protein